MRVPLAWNNLRHQPGRTAIAIAGVVFALVLIFMQLGFLGAVRATATQIYDKLQFDLIIVSSKYVNLQQSRSIPHDRLVQALTVPGVQTASPLHIGFLNWKYPPEKDTSPKQQEAMQSIMLLAYTVGDPVFAMERFGQPESFAAGLNQLSQLDTVLMDRRSQPLYGLGENETGVRTELGNQQIEVVGRFTIGAGFASNGLLISSRRTYARASGINTQARANLGLLTIDRSVGSPESMQQSLQERLPEDVQVFTRKQLLAQEQRYWLQETSVGVIFGIGVAVALIVGVVFVYQVIASDISKQLPEYATLKAIGYDHGYLASVVVRQAIYLAILSYIPGVLIAWVLFVITRSTKKIPMTMQLETALWVLLAGVGMCCLSGLFALRKVQKAEPASLF